MEKQLPQEIVTALEDFAQAVTGYTLALVEDRDLRNATVRVNLATKILKDAILKAIEKE